MDMYQVEDLREVKTTAMPWPSPFSSTTPSGPANCQQTTPSTGGATRPSETALLADGMMVSVKAAKTNTSKLF